MFPPRVLADPRPPTDDRLPVVEVDPMSNWWSAMMTESEYRRKVDTRLLVDYLQMYQNNLSSAVYFMIWPLTSVHVVSCHYLA